jgi:hypothetical protein
MNAEGREEICSSSAELGLEVAAEASTTIPPDDAFIHFADFLCRNLCGEPLLHAEFLAPAIHDVLSMHPPETQRHPALGTYTTTPLQKDKNVRYALSRFSRQKCLEQMMHLLNHIHGNPVYFA